MSGDNKKTQQVAAPGQIGHNSKKRSSGPTDAEKAKLNKEIEYILGKIGMMPDFAKRKIREGCDVWLNRDRGQAPPLNSEKDRRGNSPAAPGRSEAPPKKVKWQKTALGAQLRVTQHMDRKQHPNRDVTVADAWGNVGGAVGAALVRAWNKSMPDVDIAKAIDEIALDETVASAQQFVKSVGVLFQSADYTPLTEQQRIDRRAAAKAEKAKKKAEKAAKEAK